MYRYTGAPSKMNIFPKMAQSDRRIFLFLAQNKKNN